MVSRENWRINEPGEPLPPEQPQRMLRLVLRAYSEDVIGRSRVEELLGDVLGRAKEKQHQQLGE